MAETDAKASGGALKFLTQKVGPLPLYAWAGAAVIIWWYLQKKNAPAAAGANQQTDPAGNVGTIDPATGYVQGSPEDQASLAAESGAGVGGSAGQNATTGAQTYADNNAWGIAAVNYLTGKQVNGTEANDAIENYLNSQVLTTAQQGDVNLAIAALGAPPTLPAPATAATTSTTSTPTGSASTGTTPAGSSGSSGSASASGAAGQSTVTNGRQTAKGSATATIAWDGHGRANSWRLIVTGPGAINGHVGTTTVPVGVYGGLESKHNYYSTITPLYNGQPDGPAGRVDFSTS